MRELYQGRAYVRSIKHIALNRIRINFHAQRQRVNASRPMQRLASTLNILLRNIASKVRRLISTLLQSEFIDIPTRESTEGNLRGGCGRCANVKAQG